MIEPITSGTDTALDPDEPAKSTGRMFPTSAAITDAVGFEQSGQGTPACMAVAMIFHYC